MPISSCRCGLPSANASWELAPTQVVQLDCHNWYVAMLPNQATGFGWVTWGRSRPWAMLGNESCLSQRGA